MHEKINSNNGLKWRNSKKRNLWIEMNDFKWMYWKPVTWIEKLKQIDWNAWIAMNEFTCNELTWMNRHEWFSWANWHEGMQAKDWKECVEMNKLENGMNVVAWRTWSEWVDMNELENMSWHERIEAKELKYINWQTPMNWNERIESDELRRMNCSEFIDVNELKFLNWHEWMKTHILTSMHCMNESIKTNEWK